MNNTRKDTKKTRKATQRRKNKTLDAKWIWNLRLYQHVQFLLWLASWILRKLARTDARKRIPTEKGRQFEIQRLKESRKTALTNLTKQINVILALLADFENEKQVRIEVVQLDQLFAKMQEVHLLIPNYRVSKGKSVCTNLNRIQVVWKAQS